VLQLLAIASTTGVLGFNLANVPYVPEATSLDEEHILIR
jgi:hypothetical protein